MIQTVLLFLTVIVGTHAQQIPPVRHDGFIYPSHRFDPDTILIEAFFDPVCSDSRDSWPPLKKALQHYGSRVGLVLHLFPLPYHDNTYVTSRALHIVNTTLFYGAQTQLLSRPAVVEKIVKFGAVTLGKSYQSVLKSGFNNTKSDHATRVSFKYSSSRGVYAAPTFYVNGFVLSNAASPSDFGGWRKIIDPLVKTK